MTRRRGNVFMNPAGWAYASPQGSLDTSGTPAADVVDPTPYGTVIASYNGTVGITEAGLGIDTWEDTFGDGNDVQQTTDGNRPSLSAADADFNGKDVVLFDGVDEYIGRTTFVAPGAQAQPTTVILAHKLRVVTGTSHYFDGPTARNMARNSGGTAEIFAGSAVQALWTTDTALRLEVFIYNGVSNIAYRDGVLDTPAGSAGADAFNGINIGANTSAGVGEFYDGKIGTLTVLDGLLSSANLNGYMNELATFYGGTWADI